MTPPTTRSRLFKTLCLPLKRSVSLHGHPYPERVPKLWNETIDAHRQAVREAILDAAATLIEDGGLRAVTMSQLAERAGIGRATLYKYFPDAEAVLGAWHERQVTAHLHGLAEAAHRPGTAAHDRCSDDLV